MEDERITRIKQRILFFLKAKKMSIFELSLKSEIADPTIRNWFSKRNYIPSLDSLIKVCDVLGITLSELTLDENEKSYPVSEEVQKLLLKFSTLSASEKNAVESVIKSYKSE